MFLITSKKFSTRRKKDWKSKINHISSKLNEYERADVQLQMKYRI